MILARETQTVFRQVKASLGKSRLGTIWFPGWGSWGHLDSMLRDPGVTLDPNMAPRCFLS